MLLPLDTTINGFYHFKGRFTTHNGKVPLGKPNFLSSGGGEGKKQKTRIQNNTLPFWWFCFNEHMHESYLMHNYKSMKYLML